MYDESANDTNPNLTESSHPAEPGDSFRQATTPFFYFVLLLLHGRLAAAGPSPIPEVIKTKNNTAVLVVLLLSSCKNIILL